MARDERGEAAERHQLPERPPRFRFDRRAACGACGDFGTFIPLTVGMVSQCGLDLGATLFFTGVMNIASGAVFGIPIPVQPMKAIAAVAIAEGLAVPEIMAAGLITATVVLLLSVFGLTDFLLRAIPRSVVRGLQLAIGLKLMIRGLALVAGTGQLLGWDSMLLGALCGLFVLCFYSSRKLPTALVVVAVGLASLAIDRPELWSGLHLGWNWPGLAALSFEDWKGGLLLGAIPQIPLTLLNSVLAVCVLSGDLFPRRRLPARGVSLSVGLMNLIGCPFGMMPVCHGSGGLAAQYRFGARTGGSMVILGSVKIVLALLFGGSLFVLLRHFPQSILGVLLLFGGLELAMVCRDQTERTAFFIMLGTAALCLGAGIAVGVLIGWFVGVLFSRGWLRLERQSGGK